jgi:hypothetical protein
MPQTTTASATFTNRRAALRAAHRLVEGGFSRDSVEMRRLHSDDDDYQVSVRVQEGNVERAGDLLHARPDIHGFAGDRVNVGPLIAFAGALAVGVAGYTLYALQSRPGKSSPRSDRPLSRTS